MALTDEGIIDVPGMASRWVRLASGAKAHYMTAGDHGPAVVLLHGGLPGSSGTAGWRFMMPYLAERGFRVYAPDMPGFGLADTNFPPKSLADHVDFVHEFTTALCLDRFHLAGNSMGCVNTINYVVAHPERVISYALIAGGIGDALPDDAPRVPGANVTRFSGTPESMREMMEAIIYRSEAISDDLLQMRFSAAERHAPMMGDFMKSIVSYKGDGPWADPNVGIRLSTRGRIEKLTIPAIYLYGRQDVLSPVENGYLQEDVLPNVQFFYPDECGHQGQTDQPEMFNTVFAEFFGTGRVSRATADWAGVSTRRPELPSIVEQAEAKAS